MSDPWLGALAEIQGGDVAADDALAKVRINLVVKDVPFGTGMIAAHLDTAGGVIDIGVGHIDGADVTVQLGYRLAKSIIVDGDGQAAMVAFLTRKLRVDGDMGKLLAFQAASPTEHQKKVTEQIKAMTA